MPLSQSASCEPELGSSSFVSDEGELLVFERHFDEDFDIQDIVDRMFIGNLNSLAQYRRVYWFILLGLFTGKKTHNWLSILEHQRFHYQQLQQATHIKPRILTSLDPQIFHPLSNSENNPWKQHQKNEALLQEIWKDVVRTFPERSFFNESTTRQMMQRILFVWCKEHPEVSYKQGMNELLAIFLLVCHRCSHTGNDNDSVYANICSTALVEADAFILFGRLMDLGMKSMFLSNDNKTTASSSTLNKSRGHPLEKPFKSLGTEPGERNQSAILVRCNYIFHQILRRADPALYEHLSSLSIEPQIFLLRWIRLLFSREFHIDDTILVWDAFFSDIYSRQNAADCQNAVNNASSEKIASSLSSDTHKEVMPLVDYFAIAMMKFVRSNLMSADSSGCLSRLLKFPPLESVVPLVQLAIQLQLDFSSPLSQNSNSSAGGSSTQSPPLEAGVIESFNISNSRRIDLPRKSDNNSILNAPNKGNFKGTLFRMDESNSTDFSTSFIASNAFLQENISILGDSAPSIKIVDGSKVSGIELGRQVFLMENHLKQVILEVDIENPIRDELGKISHDLDVLKKILRGELSLRLSTFKCTSDGFNLQKQT